MPSSGVDDTVLAAAASPLDGDPAAEEARAAARAAEEQALTATRAAVEQDRTAQMAREAALARAAEADREAAAAQADLDAAAAHLRAVQERAAAERAAVLPPAGDDDNSSHHGDGDDYIGNLQDALLQQEATVLLNLHVQAVSVQNIRTLVPLLLDVNSSFYARWKESFLDVLGKDYLEPHVLCDAVAPSSPSWVRMNCVVRTCLLGVISTWCLCSHHLALHRVPIS